MTWTRHTSRDCGIGVTRQPVDRIVDPFMQAHPIVRRRVAGTGVGLILRRRSVERLGGLDLGSEPRIGTRAAGLS